MQFTVNVKSEHTRERQKKYPGNPWKTLKKSPLCTSVQNFVSEQTSKGYKLYSGSYNLGYIFIYGLILFHVTYDQKGTKRIICWQVLYTCSFTSTPALHHWNTITLLPCGRNTNYCKFWFVFAYSFFLNSYCCVCLSEDNIYVLSIYLSMVTNIKLEK